MTESSCWRRAAKTGEFNADEARQEAIMERADELLKSESGECDGI